MHEKQKDGDDFKRDKPDGSDELLDHLRTEKRPSGEYRGEGSLGESEPNRSDDAKRDRDEEHDLEETLDRERHGSGEYDPEERYGRMDVAPDRKHAGPGDEDEPDTAEDDPKRGTSPRKQNPT